MYDSELKMNPIELYWTKTEADLMFILHKEINNELYRRIKYSYQSRLKKTRYLSTISLRQKLLEQIDRALCPLVNAIPSMMMMMKLINQIFIVHVFPSMVIKLNL